MPGLAGLVYATDFLQSPVGTDSGRLVQQDNTVNIPSALSATHKGTLVLILVRIFSVSQGFFVAILVGMQGLGNQFIDMTTLFH